MTPQERKYLGGTKKSRIDYKKWFVDIAIGGAIAATLAGIIIGLAVAIVFITPGAHAEVIENNAFYCSEIAAGRANVAPEDREEVTSYCESL